MLPSIWRSRVTPSLWGELDRDVDRFLRIGLGGAPSLSGWSPAVDVQETPDGYVVRAELPGLKPEDVEVSVENGVLSLSGEKKAEYEAGSEASGNHLVERRYGRFQRNFSLPRSVDPDKVDARFDSGLLTVSLPKAAEAKPRRIKVTS